MTDTTVLRYELELATMRAERAEKRVKELEKVLRPLTDVVKERITPLTPTQITVNLIDCLNAYRVLKTEEP